MQTPHSRQEELGSLFAAVDQARRSLARLDQERAQLLEEIARLNAAADQAQQALSPAERAAAHAAYLAIALARVDEEMRPDTQPAAGADAGPGAPGGMERRATPRPATIRLPGLAPVFAHELGEKAPAGTGLLGRARALLGRSAQA